MVNNGNGLDSKGNVKAKLDDFRKGAAKTTAQIGDKAGVVLDKVKSANYRETKGKITSSGFFRNDDEPIAKIYTFLAAMTFLFPALSALTQLGKSAGVALGVIAGAGLASFAIYVFGQITSNSIKASSNALEVYKELYGVEKGNYTGDITVVVSGFFWLLAVIFALIGAYGLYLVFTEVERSSSGGFFINTRTQAVPLTQKIFKATGVFAGTAPFVLFSHSMSKIVSGVREAEFYTAKIKQRVITDTEK